MHNVTPLKKVGRVVQQPVSNAIDFKQRRQKASEPQPHQGPPLSDFSGSPAEIESHFYRANGLPSEALRRLKREGRGIRASLDLHGLNIDQARTQLHEFIKLCCSHGYKRVRVIHGQGFGSTSGTSVLRQQTRYWLSQMHEVLGYVSPNSADGGEGAVLVLLRTTKDINEAS